MLRCIQRRETDPYFNLAAEEFLLKSAATDTFMTWSNQPSVVIGKHQNAFREINHSFVEMNQLPVIRRITGGGTVYHDAGNLNFSFIYTGRKENLIDFREFTLPVILFLQDLGLNASFEGKNNITVNGLKVSGNSAHLFKNKVLHHGTLLFSADLKKLDQAIASNEGLYKDKAVRSIRANVVNISDLLNNKMTYTEFISRFKAFIFNYFQHVHENDLHPEEINAIYKLAEEKYRSDKWNYGYSPDYEFNERWNNDEDQYSIKLIVKDGLINRVEIAGPEEDSMFLQFVQEALAGVAHEKKSIRERFKKLTFADDIHKKIVNQIVDHLF